MYDLMSTPYIITITIGRRFIGFGCSWPLYPWLAPISPWMFFLFVICHFSERVFDFMFSLLEHPFLRTLAGPGLSRFCHTLCISGGFP